MPRDNRSPRILITRLGHIGDCILTVPVLNALRAHFPRAFLAWVVEPPSDQLLRDHAALDELVVVRRGWLRSPATVWRVGGLLRWMRLGISIDPQSLTKSALLGRLAGAGQRLGLSPPVGRELAPLLNNHLIQPSSSHVVDRSLELLRPLGIDNPRIEFCLPMSETAEATMDQFIRAAHLGGGFAVIHPGAGWRSRLWSSARFGAVARHLGRQHALPTVVTWAGDGERRAAERVVARSGGHALLAPATSLIELASLLRKANLFVGCDTGPMHLAAAVGTDCVVLHGTTQPEISGPYGARHVTVQAYYQAGTSRQRRRASNDAMMAIPFDTVCDACDRMMHRQADARAGNFVSVA